MIDPLRIIGEYLRANVASPAGTTLGAAITTVGALSITVVDGSVWATYDAPLALKIDSEYVLGVRSANVVTVDLGARGALGSTAATHSNGATISLANLYMLAGSQIWPDKLPLDFANTVPAIMFRIRGGAGAETLLPVWNGSIEVFCYGGSANYDDALALDRALVDRLHNTTMVNTASGCILNAQQEVATQNATEQDTEWPRTFSAYNIGLRSL